MEPSKNTLETPSFVRKHFNQSQNQSCMINKELIKQEMRIKNRGKIIRERSKSKKNSNNNSSNLKSRKRKRKRKKRRSTGLNLFLSIILTWMDLKELIQTLII